MKVKNSYKFLSCIFILVVSFSLSIYTIGLGQEKLIEDLKDCEPGIYNVIPINIWYMLLSFAIMLVGVFLIAIVLGFLKGGEKSIECFYRPK